MPVDPKTELPEYIVDAAWSRDGTAEDAEAVRNWIEETQNINATYTQWHPREVPGQTLLYHLTRGPFTASKLDLVRLLIARGADVNIRDAEGQSPLHNATETWDEMSPVLVSLLLDAGATDLNTRTWLSTKTLGNAILSCHQSPEVALKISRILIRAGASLDRVHYEKSAEQYLAALERRTTLGPVCPLPLTVRGHEHTFRATNVFLVGFTSVLKLTATRIGTTRGTRQLSVCTNCTAVQRLNAAPVA